MGEVARRRSRRVEGMNGERDGEIDPVSATQVAEKERTKIRTGVGDSSCREEKTRWGVIARDKNRWENRNSRIPQREHAAQLCPSRLRAAAKYSNLRRSRCAPADDARRHVAGRRQKTVPCDLRGLDA